MRRSLLFTISYALTAALVASVSQATIAHAQAFTTFDAYGPDSTYTRPFAINDRGQIVGSSMPAIPDCFGGPPAFCQQGFFRDTDGTVSTIGPTPGRPNYFTAAATAINQWGLAVGYILDESGSDGFLRNADGTLTDIRYSPPPTDTFVDPNGFAVPYFPPTYPPDHGLVATSINDWGQIVGAIGEGGARGLGFLRRVHGTFTTFRAPSNIAPFDTLPQAINDFGQITGYFLDLDAWHGFLRQWNGSFVVFDAIQSGGTYALAINQLGEITGSYQDIPFPNQNYPYHGFLRRRGGKIVTFDPPGSVNTLAAAINIQGQIAGYYFDAGGFAHGFIRQRNGHIDTFDVPGVGVSATFAQGINDFGQITGYYTDPGGTHGFVTERP